MMVATSVWVCVLLAVASCVYASSHNEHKSISESTSMKILVRSHYNKTGRWHSQVVFKQDAGILPGDEEISSHWDIDVKQTSSVCDEARTCLETTIYLTTPPLIPGQQSTGRNYEEIPPLIDIATPASYKYPPTIPPTPKREPPKPVGYRLYPDVGFYKFNHNVTTWPKAQEICSKDGGHLVIINSPAEREVVRDLFAVKNPKSPGSTNPNQIHAGLKYVAKGKYATVSGVPIEETGFSVWHPGQPSSGAHEPCVSIMVEDIAYNDISCVKQILPFICEIENK